MRAGPALAQAAGGLDAVAVRHAQVHQDDVGAQSAGQRERLLAVRGGPDDLDPGQEPQQHLEALADDPLVVRDQHPDRAHAGTHSSTRKPISVAAAASVPPSSSARSRMPVSP